MDQFQNRRDCLEDLYSKIIEETKTKNAKEFVLIQEVADQF